jgi:hypothetical protein
VRHPGRAHRRAALAGAAALLLAGAVVLAVGLLSRTTHTAAATPSGSVSAPAPIAAPPHAASAPTAASRPAPAALATPTSPVHLVIPSVRLDVPLLALTPRGGTIDPPTLTAGYWLAPYGGPVGPGRAPTNTLYLAGHSWTGGRAAFNPLMHGGPGGWPISPGAVVEVRGPTGTRSYTVTRTKRYAKARLPSATEVWRVVPGRLVLLTCFLDGRGHANDENFVVTASSAGSGAAGSAARSTTARG